MTIKAIAMLVALAATMGVFTWSAWRKTMVLLKAKPDNTRFDQIWRRVEEVLTVAIGQKKMFKEPLAGTMHAFIFWGFLVLLFRSISVVGQAFSPEWTIFWFWGDLQNVYTLAKDISELAVLVMIGFAFFRRFVLKPWRISLSWDANLVLFLIGFLMLSDFLMDGAKFAITPGTVEESWAPIGATVAGIYKSVGLGEGVLHVIEESFYWLHIGALFFFLNYLPHSKHMHVLTVIQNVFFVNLRPGKALHPIKDIEDQETFGAGKIEEFTWKDILDIYTCTECGRCMTNCPTTLTDKALRPKDLTERMKHYLPVVEPYLLGKKEGEPEQSLIDVAQWEAIWDCTTCGSCEENCPQQIEYVGRIVEMRRFLLLMEANNPKELNVTLRGLENKSNPWGLSMGDRAAWAKEDKVPTYADKPDAEYLLYLGCAASYDDRSIKVAKALVRLLDHAEVSYAVLGSDEGCCGDQARRVGNEYLAQIQAQTNIEAWNELGVKKIITLCPHGYNMIKNEYAEFGGAYEVVHHTELLHDLVFQGKLKPLKEVSTGKITFHDSCYLGRYNHIYDQPRKLLDQIPGLERVEMERTRENGFCCGAGGGRVWMEEHKGTRINQYRIDQAMEVKPDTIVSACPFCLMMFKDGIAEKGYEDSLKAVDLAEILAESCL